MLRAGYSVVYGVQSVSAPRHTGTFGVTGVPSHRQGANAIVAITCVALQDREYLHPNRQHSEKQAYRRERCGLFNDCTEHSLPHLRTEEEQCS
jgi:hypothetical protein